MLFVALAEMGTVLGKTDEVKMWRELDQGLGDHHVGPDGELWLDAKSPLRESHRHQSNIIAFHPFNLITIDGSDTDRQRIAASMPWWSQPGKPGGKLGTGAWVGFSFPWVACACARAGDAEGALQHLQVFESRYTTRNGFNENTPGAYVFTLEANFLAMQAVNEMLLQSWSPTPGTPDTGVIRIFPAMPWAWHDASFCELRAEGGCKVSATRENNATTWFKIVAGKRGLVRIRDNFGGRIPKWNVSGVNKKGNNFELELKEGHAVEATFDTAVHAGNAALGVPTLDDLAGDWMEVATIRNFPSVNNFRGALQTHPNLTTFLLATFPPYANGGDSGVLTLNGKPVTATGSRWYPYQVLRRATVDGVEMESAIRMPFEQRGVFCRLTLKNTTAKPLTLDLTWAFSGRVCRHPDAAWATWSSPHGEAGNTIALVGADAKVLSAVGNKGSEPAAIAIAFSQAPADLKVVTDGGVATWKINLASNQTVSLAYTTAMDKEPVAATELATRWAESFDQSFALAKSQWEDRWQAAFTPSNKHFSGHLPTLLTDDLKIRRVYYQGVLAALMLCRTDLPAAKRCFVTAGPQWAVTLMYFWDTEMWANAWAMLEPISMKELLTKWLAMDQHGCYALDCLSGKGAGPWYAANDWSIFRCVDAYLGVTGDKAFLSQVIHGKTVLQRLEDIATFYEQRPLTKASLLADYGGPGNLLECSERYVQGVASLNAANVYMLRRMADYCEQSGNAARAQVLRDKAGKLLPDVMALYKPGEGVWNARDNSRQGGFQPPLF